MNIKDRKKINLFFLATFISASFALYLTWQRFRPGSDLSPEAYFPTPVVKVDNFRLWQDFDRDGQYDRYFVRGLVYSPLPIGREHGDQGSGDPARADNIFEDEALLRRDFELLNLLNVNTIRIWQANDPIAVQGFVPHITRRTLDLAEEYGLKVIPGFAIETAPSICENRLPVSRSPDFTDPDVRQEYITLFADFVKTFKDHPAVLFWAIGNGSNAHLNPRDYRQIIAYYGLMDEMAKAARLTEGETRHPVALVNDNLTFIGSNNLNAADDDLEHIDIWGINLYREKSWGTFIAEYLRLSKKAIWISEFGVDAWRTFDPIRIEEGKEDPAAQAHWLGRQWDDLCGFQDFLVGATAKEFSDRWGADRHGTRRGHASTHDTDGVIPYDQDCDGTIDVYPVAPDKVYNDEWWGLVALSPADSGLDNTQQRLAFYALRERFACWETGDKNIFFSGTDNGKSCDGTSACCLQPEMKAKNSECVASCEPTNDTPS